MMIMTMPRRTSTDCMRGTGRAYAGLVIRAYYARVGRCNLTSGAYIFTLESDKSLLDGKLSKMGSYMKTETSNVSLA